MTFDPTGLLWWAGMCALCWFVIAPDLKDPPPGAAA